MLGETPPHFERAVHYTRLTKSQVAELEADFSNAEMDVYRMISQKASDMKKQETGSHRFRAGSFFFKERME